MADSNVSVRRVLAVVGLCGTLGGTLAQDQQDQKAAPLREAGTILGILTCSITGQFETNPDALQRDVLCDFRPGSHGADESYTGTVRGFGQPNELFGTGTIVLEVKGSASAILKPGMLQQVYSTDAAQSSVAAAAPLIGATDTSIVLQPIEEREGRVAEGKMRPDAAIIQVELKLKSSPA